MLEAVKDYLEVLKTKPSAFSPAEAERFSTFFRALADETRLEIVGLLAAAKSELCVCEIEPHFVLSQPTISHHLKLLREAGVVTSERRGTWVYYALDPEASEAIESFRLLLKR